MTEALDGGERSLEEWKPLCKVKSETVRRYTVEVRDIINRRQQIRRPCLFSHGMRNKCILK